jgi:tetratricopeptide (TPR) repeat protein
LFSCLAFKTDFQGRIGANEKFRLLKGLNRSNIEALLLWSHPSSDIVNVVKAVLISFGLSVEQYDWAKTKTLLSASEIFSTLRSFDWDDIQKETAAKVHKFLVETKPNPHALEISAAAKVLYKWVSALDGIYTYSVDSMGLYSRVNPDSSTTHTEIQNPDGEMIQSRNHVFGRKSSNRWDLTPEKTVFTEEYDSHQVQEEVPVSVDSTEEPLPDPVMSNESGSVEVDSSFASENTDSQSSNSPFSFPQKKPMDISQFSWLDAKEWKNKENDGHHPHQSQQNPNPLSQEILRLVEDEAKKRNDLVRREQTLRDGISERERAARQREVLEGALFQQQLDSESQHSKLKNTSFSLKKPGRDEVDVKVCEEARTSFKSDFNQHETKVDGKDITTTAHDISEFSRLFEEKRLQEQKKEKEHQELENERRLREQLLERARREREKEEEREKIEKMRRDREREEIERRHRDKEKEEGEKRRKENRAEQEKDRGNQFYKQRKYKEAVECYTKAIQAAPACAAFYSNRAAAYLMQGSYDLCISDCNICLSKDRNYVKAYARRGKCYVKMERWEDAMKDFTTAVSLENSDEAVAGLDAVWKHRCEDYEKTRPKVLDHYKVLELSKGATSQEIKKAYHKLALKWHPDRLHADCEQQKRYSELIFKEISEAHTVLLDPKRKEVWEKDLSEYLASSSSMHSLPPQRAFNTSPPTTSSGPQPPQPPKPPSAVPIHTPSASQKPSHVPNPKPGVPRQAARGQHHQQPPQQPPQPPQLPIWQKANLSSSTLNAVSQRAPAETARNPGTTVTATPPVAKSTAQPQRVGTYGTPSYAHPLTASHKKPNSTGPSTTATSSHHPVTPKPATSKSDLHDAFAGSIGLKQSNSVPNLTKLKQPADPPQLSRGNSVRASFTGVPVAAAAANHTAKTPQAPLGYSGNRSHYNLPHQQSFANGGGLKVAPVASGALPRTSSDASYF